MKTSDFDLLRSIKIPNQDLVVENTIAQIAVIELIRYNTSLLHDQITKTMKRLGYEPTQEKIQRMIDSLIQTI
jgi:hypothetical protein